MKTLKLNEPLGQWSLDGIMAHFHVDRETAKRLGKGEDVDISVPASDPTAETNEDVNNAS